MKKSMLILVAFAAVLAANVSSAAAAPPVQVDFAKSVSDPANFVFTGTTSGAVSGGLTSSLVSLDGSSGPILHITFRWEVSAGAQSFVAVTSGIWNTKTGAVTMNGRVVSGYLQGARVHEEGQLVDPSTLSFEGFLRLLPGTAA